MIATKNCNNCIYWNSQNCNKTIKSHSKNNKTFTKKIKPKNNQKLPKGNTKACRFWKLYRWNTY